MSVPHAIVGGMGWADVVEVALNVVPKAVATMVLVVLLAYVAITHDPTPIMWWVHQIATSVTETMLPALVVVGG